MVTELSTAGDALLTEILESPEKDDIRLIYADWLNDHGEPERAAFIRAGVAAGPLTWKETTLAGWPHREATFIPLWNAWRQWPSFVERAFAFGLPDGWHSWLADSETTSYTPEAILCRGFVHQVKCSCADWLRHGPALVRRHPVQEVQLVDKEPYQAEGPLWAWYLEWAEHDHTIQFRLPGRLYAKLDRYIKEPLKGRTAYHTHGDAEEALSRACLAWAKGEQE